MTRRHLIDTRTAAGLLLGVLHHHLGRPATFADFALVEDACCIVSGGLARLVIVCHSDGQRFFIDVDMDSIPAMRAIMGAAVH